MERCRRGERLRPARRAGRRVHLWPFTQVLHAGALVTPLTGAGRAEHETALDEMVRGLAWYRSGDAWGPTRGDRPRYADDVAWVGLALAALTPGGAPPTEVGQALRFAMTCEHPDGGVRWHEGAATRHACATAPAAHLAMLVHGRTGDEVALAFARRSMAWVEAVLRRDDGLVADHVNGEVDPTAWAYNQGEAATAWSLLAATGDPHAASARDRAVAAAVAWLTTDELWRHPQVFVGIAARCLLPIDATGVLHDAVATHLDRVAVSGFAADGFPDDAGAGRYGDDVAIDMAGLIQTAAALAGEG